MTQESAAQNSGGSQTPEAAIILTGVVVPGVTCPAVQLASGETIALSHLSSEFSIGDRVTVYGSGYAGSPSCQQEVLMVVRAVAAP